MPQVRSSVAACLLSLSDDCSSKKNLASLHDALRFSLSLSFLFFSFFSLSLSLLQWTAALLSSEIVGKLRSKVLSNERMPLAADASSLAFTLSLVFFSLFNLDLDWLAWTYAAALLSLSPQRIFSLVLVVRSLKRQKYSVVRVLLSCHCCRRYRNNSITKSLSH